MLRDFIVGEENRLATVAARSILEPNTAYRPLVLYGPTGTGKSHLAAGLARRWNQRRPKRTATCATGADFARQYATAVEIHALDEFRARYRKAPLFVLDDLTELTGKDAAQQELAATIDGILAGGGRVIVTSRQSPLQMSAFLPALASRLSAGLTVPLSSPGPLARAAILQQLATRRGARLTDEAARLMADALPVTAPRLNAALLELLNTTEPADGDIDACVVRQYLAARSGGRPPSLRSIASLTARYFELKVTDLKSPSRRRSVVQARAIAMFIARQLTGKSCAAIGRHFGGRDHSTVLHSCRQTEKRIKTDQAVGRAVDKLRMLLIED